MSKVENNSFFYKNNRLQQIRGFYYAVRFQSISKAAEAINLTQSTVTLQIQSLERDLGVKLINRADKKSFLTKDGKEFYKMSCHLIQEFESVADNFLNKRFKKNENIIRIGIHHIAISYFMPKVLAEFKKIYPEVKIILHNISPQDAIQRVINEEIDFAFFPNIKKVPEIDLCEITSYRPTLVMRKNNPNAGKSVTKLQDLRRYDLIRIDQNLITLPLFEEAFQTYKLKGSIEFENGNWEMLKSIVKKTDSVAFLSTICVSEKDKELSIVDLSRFFPEMIYSVVTKNKSIQNKKVKKMLEIIKSNV